MFKAYLKLKDIESIVIVKERVVSKDVKPTIEVFN